MMYIAETSLAVPTSDMAAADAVATTTTATPTKLHQKLSFVSNDSGYGPSSGEIDPLTQFRLHHTRANNSCPSLTPPANSRNNSYKDQVEASGTYSLDVKSNHRISWPLNHTSKPGLQRNDSGYAASFDVEENEQDDEAKSNCSQEKQASFDSNELRCIRGPPSLVDGSETDSDSEENLDDEDDYDLESDEDDYDEYDEYLFKKLPAFAFSNGYRGHYQKQYSLLTIALQTQPRVPFKPLLRPRSIQNASQQNMQQLQERRSFTISDITHTHYEEIESQEFSGHSSHLNDITEDETDPSVDLDLISEVPKCEEETKNGFWSWWPLHNTIPKTTPMKTDHWQPDSSCKSCKFCYKPFTFTRRRHHCRICGGIFCAECSSGMTRLNPATAEPAEDGTYLGRICANCHHDYRLKDWDWFSSRSAIGSALLSSVEVIEKRWNVRVGMGWIRAFAMAK